MSPPKGRNGGKHRQGSGVPKWVPPDAGAPPREKSPRSLNHDHDDINRRCPVWRFEDHDGEWPSGYHNLQSEGYRDIFAKLASFETQTVGELWGPQTNNHQYDVAELPPEAAKRLRDIQRDDETLLHSLRLTGKFRLIGILRENIYYLLWVDPEHQAWPSPKKHT